MTTAYCLPNSDNKETEQKTDASSDNKATEEPTETPSNDTESQEKTEASSDDTDTTWDYTDEDQRFVTKKEMEAFMAEAERHFITRKEMKYLLAAAIVLFTAAGIKNDFFPSAEQERLRALNGADIGISGMSRSFEILATILLCPLLR